MVKRLSVKNTTPKQVVPPNGEAVSGNYEYTILNTDPTNYVELVDSEGGTWNTGFPLPPGSAWSGNANATEKLYVIAKDATAVSVAVIGVATA